MNKNNFLRILSLSLLLLPLNVYVNEAESIDVYENTPEITETEPTPEPSYWRQYAPQLLQDAGDYAASFVPQSVKDRIRWSTKKKIAIAGAILTSLAAVYNRDILMTFVNDVIEKNRQEKFERYVWSGVTDIQVGLDPITKHRGSKEFSIALERDLHTTMTY